MKPPGARTAFDELAGAIRGRGVNLQTGVFGADMRIALVNDGPVTLVVDSRS
jgi:D-tyrosyl-tRNA(Tyr) deacylase